MRVNRRLLFALAFLSVVTAVTAVTTAYIVRTLYFPIVPSLAVDEVDSVEIELFEWESQQAANVKSADASGIERLLSVIATAERTDDHKCGPVGTVTFKLKKGPAQEISVLPGHDDRYYEFRYERKIHRVDRDEFLEALRSVGVTSILLEP